jgi:hypothetical protein
MRCLFCLEKAVLRHDLGIRQEEIYSHLGSCEYNYRMLYALQPKLAGYVGPFDIISHRQEITTTPGVSLVYRCKEYKNPGSISYRYELIRVGQ